MATPWAKLVSTRHRDKPNINVIFSFIPFHQRGTAMRCLADSDTVADLQGELITSFLLGGEDWDPDYLPDVDLVLMSASRCLLRSPALVPGFAKLPDRRSLLRYLLDDRGVPIQCRDHKELAMQACETDGAALSNVSGRLKHDHDVVTTAVRQNGFALLFAPQSFKEDKGVVLAAVQQNGLALQHASVELKNDRDVVTAAVSQDGMALAMAYDSLKSDPEVVAAAVAQNPAAIDLVSAAPQGVCAGGYKAV